MQRIGFVVYPGFQVIALAAASAFEVANIDLGGPVYEMPIVSETGGIVVGSAGMAMATTQLADSRFDTLIVCGGVEVPVGSPGLIATLHESVGTVRRIAAICTGAFVLAQAGLLEGRRATTHWYFADEMRRRYPGVKLDPDRIFIEDGPFWTSAGMSAGIDLALGLIEKDFGRDLARSVARQLVLYHRRAGGQSQHSALLKLEPKTDRIQSALAYAQANLKAPLPIETLADAARLSPRQFSRVFRSETGQSPAKAIEQLRVEAARLMLERGRHPIEVVARETGFADRDRMRRAFLRTLGQPPQAIRQGVAAD